MSTDEPLERELKFPCSDLDRLRERLQGLEAERLRPSSFEDNLVLDRNGEIAAAGCLLRLRVDAGGARLTYKGQASFEGGAKVRVEHEARSDDAEALLKILESVGFQVADRYQKYREEWRLGGVIIALDHTPIGDFVEFEGKSAARLARRCGFEAETAELRNYLKLYEDFRAGHPDAPAEMVFP